MDVIITKAELKNIFYMYIYALHYSVQSLHILVIYQV